MSKLKPFNSKQVTYIQRSRTSWFNVAEGGKRGSKNIVNTLAWCIAVDNHDDELHLAAGVSVASARLNIIDSNGLGVKYYFAGRYRSGKYEGRDCVYVDTPKGQKVILISGGGKKGDEKYIKGNSYGTALITEANECHPDFIREVFDRTLSSSCRIIFHDLNPKPPKHWYYRDILDFHFAQQKKNKKYGFNYEHFTIADNPSIPDEVKRQILSTYDTDSIWFKRDILGLRIAAEGAVYPLFANHPKDFIIKTAPPIILGSVGVDFGGNKSGQSFSLVGFTPRYAKKIILDEEYRKGALDNPATLAAAFSFFVQRNIRAYPALKYAFADSAEQVLIRGLAAELKKDKVPLLLRNSLKLPIIDRIRLDNLLLSQGRLEIMEHCKYTQDAFAEALWDDKADEDKRLDNFTSNIDMLDSQEYGSEAFIGQLNSYKAVA